MSQHCLSGDERFRRHGEATESSIGDFWRWSASNLTDNTQRGLLAEYLVATAVGQADGVRIEWDPYDVTTATGQRIEVKSAARWQSWSQAKPSPVSFGIARTRAWDAQPGSSGSCR